ncbi:MAG: D-aminoacyl-tRNA deacylase [Eubacteriales bacterium]|nr:D-aminoacyl-tRNA deacylase [Eubacteriales bacterium]
MKFVIQVVEEAQVRVTQEADGSVPEKGPYVSGRIGRGLMVLVGIGEKDTPAIADRMVEKMRKLRIFEDENGKTNLDLAAVGGEVLLVSQFTLYADCKKGNRPSFVHAGLPEMSEPLFNYIVDKCRTAGMPVQTGVFGAFMKVSLVNDGPFTVVLDSDQMGWS